MPNQTVPGLNSITTPSSAGLLWISDPNASPQDRSFSINNLWILLSKFIVDAISGSKTYSAFTRNTCVVESSAGTVDITAGASVAGILVTILNKVAAGITLTVTTGAASVTMGVGSLTFEWDGTQWHKIGGQVLVVVQTSGSGATWKTPWAGSYKLTIAGQGGGGGGEKNTGSSTYGGAGGAGGVVIADLYEVAGATLTYTVGTTGGTGGAGTSPSNGTDGQNTTVSDGTTTLTASGGKGGVAATNGTGASGAGGAAAGGQVNIPGGAGMTGSSSSVMASIGGANVLAPSVATSTFLPTAFVGANGNVYGGGAGGAFGASTGNSAGGNGANGVVIIEF